MKRIKIKPPPVALPLPHSGEEVQPVALGAGSAGGSQVLVVQPAALAAFTCRDWSIAAGSETGKNVQFKKG